MSWRMIAAFSAVVAVSGCGGNPFVTQSNTGGSSSAVNSVKLGALQSFSYTPGASTMQINLTAQDASSLSATYTRNTSFDVVGSGTAANPDYAAYTYQETTSNRHVVALVRTQGSLSGALAMEGGQFGNYYGGGAAVRADTFSFNASNVSGKLGAAATYSGTYVGIMNAGYDAPGGPGGGLNPEIGYRTTGRALITADFTDLKVTGGIDNRRIEEVSAATDTALVGTTPTLDGTGRVVLPTINMIESDITSDGTFTGRLERGSTEVGDYTGIFSVSGDDVAALFVFQPLQVQDLEERGLIVLSSCAVAGGPACP